MIKLRLQIEKCLEIDPLQTPRLSVTVNTSTKKYHGSTESLTVVCFFHQPYRSEEESSENLKSSTHYFFLCTVANYECMITL